MSNDNEDLSLAERVTLCVQDAYLELEAMAHDADDDDEREMIKELARRIETLLGSYERSR